MSKPHLAAVVAVAVLLRWLAVWRVAVTAAGMTVHIPALMVVATAVIAVTAVFAALVVYRTRAERAMVAAWRARKQAAR